jgi:NAD(P)-dependent dehydrogenase (short-subunit alcohol dehydrogenase family)
MGIGRATAILFAREGARVGLCDIDALAGEQTIRAIEDEGGEGLFLPADVSDSNAVRAFITAVAQKFGTIDILINNAGVGSSKKELTELSEEEWLHIIDVNLHGHFYCCKYAVPFMKKSGGGAIVNTSSVLAVATFPGTLPYTTSKAALVGFTTALARELGPSKIRVNCLFPGSTDTPMMWRGVRREERAAVEAEVAAAQPLQRFGQPEEIAHAALFLAGDQASYITGAGLVVDGGLLTCIATTR